MRLEEVPLSLIDEGKRARENYKNLGALVSDIRERGLIQPIALLQKDQMESFEHLAHELDPDKPFLLLAGGRRFAAMQELEKESIAARIYDHHLDEDEVKIIELHENLIREGLDWQEETFLKKQIHDLQVKIHGEKTSLNQDGHSMRDTAKMIGEHHSTVQQDIQLATVLESNPEIFEKAKNKTDAKKLLQKMKRKLAEEELARRHREKEATTPEERLKRNLVNAYVVEDFFKGAERLESGTFDIVEIDPPYAIDLHHAKRDGGTEDYNEVDVKEYEDFMKRTLSEAHRLLKSNGWLLVWFGPEPWFEPMYQWIKDAGRPHNMSREKWAKQDVSFKVKRIPLIWSKLVGQTMQPEYNLANTYEMCFYARKGHAVIRRPGKGNVVGGAATTSKATSHPTERPIALMERVYTLFAGQGSRLLIPFAGSGTGLRAAANLGMSGIGFDLSEVYKNEHDLLVHQGKYGAYIK